MHLEIKMTTVAQIQIKYISLWAQPSLSSRRVNLAEPDGLSESQDITTKRGCASVKCRQKTGRFPTLQLVRMVYEASRTHHMSSLLSNEVSQDINAALVSANLMPNLLYWSIIPY